MRIVTLLRSLGIKEDQIYLFTYQIYKNCHYFDISPDTIVNTARQVVGLVNEVPISEIPKYIQSTSCCSGCSERVVRTVLGGAVYLIITDKCLLIPSEILNQYEITKYKE